MLTDNPPDDAEETGNIACERPMYYHSPEEAKQVQRIEDACETRVWWTGF